MMPDITIENEVTGSIHAIDKTGTHTECGVNIDNSYQLRFKNNDLSNVTCKKCLNKMQKAGK